MKNYYEVLEVNEKASQEVIDRVYKTLAKKYHPDVNPDNPKAAEEKFKEISAAYEVLSDETKRKNYDAQLENERQQAIEQRIREEKAKIQSQVQSQAKNTSYQGYVPRQWTQNQPQYQSQYQPQHQSQTQTRTEYQTQSRPVYNVSEVMYDNSENMRKMQEQMAKKAYNDAYIKAMKDMGYEIIYEKPFKEKVKDTWHLMKILATMAAIFFILWHIPPVHDWFMGLYNASGPFKDFVEALLRRL